MGRSCMVYPRIVMEKKFKELCIIDGSYMLHRSLHVQSVFDLKNSKGVRTGGIFGFLRTLNSELKKNPQGYPVVCFDSGLAERRVNADPHYKKADERNTDLVVLTPEEAEIDYVTQYHKQRNALMDILAYFGVPCLKFVNWEGDDLMYILSKTSDNCRVFTDDRDMLQLLSPTCEVRRPMADELWTLDKFVESRGYDNIEDFVIFKAVIGDGSDNIPGSCKGIGEGSVGEFIRFIKLFMHDMNNWDFTGYPSDEASMKEFCKTNNIKYKKAYLNFNKDRFLINLELVDLNRVEVPNDIFNSIVATVSNCRNQVNYFDAIKILADLEIKEFDVNDFMLRVSTREKSMMIGG